MSAVPQTSQSSQSAASKPVYPFLRVIELYLANIPEWRGGQPLAQMLKIVADGTTNNLRIRFEIKKHSLTTESPSYIYVYNLSEALRNALAKASGTQQLGGIELEMKLGWQNVPLTTVFSGSLLACYSERQGADIVTTLISIAAFGAKVEAVISQTFNAGSSLISMITSLASQLPHVTIGQVNVADHKVGNQGWSHAGGAKDCLDELAKNYRFHHWIDKGIFHACDDTKSLAGSSPPLISFKNGFLMRVEPILVGPWQQFGGVTVQSLINPSVLVGGQYQLESKLNSKLNGVYTASSLNMSGDSHANQWDMKIESLLPDQTSGPIT